MVSFQMGTSIKESTISDKSSKKRKIVEKIEENSAKDMKPSRSGRKDDALDIELHLEHPLPQDWQRCLDIQSGEIHFYNTRTHKRTCKDPRERFEYLTSPETTLDLELNLSCDSVKIGVREESQQPSNLLENSRKFLGNSPRSRNSSFSIWSSPLQTFEEDVQEMVAAICRKCHMLVMLCKSSPTCPHCKFLNPPGQNFSSKIRIQSFML